MAGVEGVGRVRERLAKDLGECRQAAQHRQCKAATSACSFATFTQVSLEQSTTVLRMDAKEHVIYIKCLRRKSKAISTFSDAA
jgi:hypothetical protein